MTLSTRIQNLKPSPIREILHVINQPGMISFAGGLPDSSSFPNIDALVVDREKLQYGPSEGDMDLRVLIAAELSVRGLPTSPEHVLVLSGSQQGIDLVAKLLIDPGTPVAIESPSYLAALQVFDLFGARYKPFTPNNCATVATAGAKLVYTVPTFQNPTGHCYNHSEREALAAACDKSDTILFEDDPYRDICFGECDRTPISSLLKKTQFIYQSSLSKTLAPGLRLGYLTASPTLFPLLVQLKQAADLHSSRVGQAMALALLSSEGYSNKLAETIERYRRKSDHFDQRLHKHFDGLATWQKPSGGLFYWLNLTKTNRYTPTFR